MRFDRGKIVCLFLQKEYFEFLSVVQTGFQYPLLNSIAVDTSLND